MLIKFRCFSPSIRGVMLLRTVDGDKSIERKTGDSSARVSVAIVSILVKLHLDSAEPTTRQLTKAPG